MKIEYRFYLSHAVNICLMVVIGLFAMHSFNQILTKLRFAEFADDLNSGFLEMRLSEKNFFLYGDDNALLEISKKIDAARQSLDDQSRDVIRAVGEGNFTQLTNLIKDYQKKVKQASAGCRQDREGLQRLREAGQKLKLFSEDITSLERERVGQIIGRTTKVMRYSFMAVIYLAFLFSLFSGQSLRRSLRRIMALTQSIARGNYQRIDTAPSPDELGAVITAINTMAEELRRREQEIVQSKRLASIGVLVAGVAHELNNPLNNISMIAQTYGEVYDHLAKEQRLGFMEQIEEQTERLRTTIKSLLDYAKPKQQQLEEKQLSEVIQKTLNLVRNMLDVSSIKLRLDLAENPPSLYIDEHQIQQVLVNMATNAIQAMKPGGELKIATRYLPEEDEMTITISDTGKGIPPELLDHIFDPFFTTKGDAGTGLGLWVSYGIIKNHQGGIHVESAVGRGTAFTITLPTCKKLKRCADES